MTVLWADLMGAQRTLRQRLSACTGFLAIDLSSMAQIGLQ